VLYAGIGLLVACLVFFGVREMHSTASPVVPNVVGMTTADATARIRHAGMTASPSTVDIAGKPAGRVFKQTPTSGKSGSKGDPIRIFIASGRVMVSATRLIGMTYAQAAVALRKLGFTVKRHDTSSAKKVGTVLALDKSGRLLEGSTITLSVAAAPVVDSVHPAGSSISGSSAGSNHAAGSNHPKPKAKSKPKHKRAGHK
jgi:serine/threonine-protein kinase